MDGDISASLSPSRSASPRSIAEPVTVSAAAAPPGHLAFGKNNPSSSGGSGGGTEDPWSDGATSTLIEASIGRFFALGRGSLTQPQWQEIADVVSSRDGYSKARKTAVQCKDYLDTLKMKHKTRKAESDSYSNLLDLVLKLEGAPGNSSISTPRSNQNTRRSRVNFRQRTRTAPMAPSDSHIAELDPSSGNGSGEGREDAWSDGATSMLIKAWGERFVTHRDGLLHSEWQEIADIVSSRNNYSKQIKSPMQCKHHFHILKKKKKISLSGPFFHMLDASLKLGDVAGNSGPVTRSNVSVWPPMDFPRRPRTRSGKRQRIEESANGAACSDRVEGLHDLAHAIRRLGEMYERVESSRSQHELRMQRYRMNAARELEEQRVQFFLKMHTDISKANSNVDADATVTGSGGDTDKTKRSGRAKRMRESSP